MSRRLRITHALSALGYSHRLALLFSASVVAFGQAPTVTSVVNSLDYSTTNLCPGVLVNIYGTNFGSSGKGVTFTVGGKAGFVVGAGPTVVAGQLPVDAPTGPTSIIVTVGGVPSAALNITLSTYAPAFSTFNGSGTGAVGATNLAGNYLTSTAPANPGDTVSVYVVGLGATNPPIATGQGATGLAPTVATPTLTIGGQPATQPKAFASSYAGLYQINFTVPAGVQGDAPLVLTIGGISSNPTAPVTLPLFGISAIVSNASFGSSGTNAACSIASLFGNGLGTTSQSTGFPSTTFQGISVTFNDTPAPLFHLTITPPAKATSATAQTIGQSQIDLLIPCELPASGQIEVAVTNSSATTPVTGPNYMLTAAAAAPGLYFQQDPSMKTRYNVLAQFNNTDWLVMPASMATALNYPGDCTANGVSPTSFCAQPAAPGAYLVVYMTGLGLATPNGDPNGQPITTGDVAPADGSVLYETVATPTVTIGGLPVKVLFSGLTPGFAGLYQVDIQAPDGVTGDDVPIAVSISGSPTDTRTVSIQVPST
jgi:uncharacterized protein (TIGR03437 family)